MLGENIAWDIYLLYILSIQAQGVIVSMLSV